MEEFYGRKFLLNKNVLFSIFEENLLRRSFFKITAYFLFLMPKVVVQKK